MKSQLFKSIVPICILFELLEKICIKDDKCYHLSKSSFKAAEYHNLVNDFCSNVITHYRASKRYYADRKLNYNKFVTIIRQICTLNNVSYTSKIVYIKSGYDIVYYISNKPDPKPHPEANADPTAQVENNECEKNDCEKNDCEKNDFEKNEN
jgi:hypothetical protein